MTLNTWALESCEQKTMPTPSNVWQRLASSHPHLAFCQKKLWDLENMANKSKLSMKN